MDITPSKKVCVDVNKSVGRFDVFKKRHGIEKKKIPYDEMGMKCSTNDEEESYIVLVGNLPRKHCLKYIMRIWENTKIYFREIRHSCDDINYVHKFRVVSRIL
jgi:hypothetical protein